MFLIHLPRMSPFWSVWSTIKAPLAECSGSASDPSTSKHLLLSETVSELDTGTYKKHFLECHLSMSLQQGYETRALTNTCPNTVHVSLSIYKKYSRLYNQASSPIWYLSLFYVSLLSELVFDIGLVPVSIMQPWQRGYHLPLCQF